MRCRPHRVRFQQGWLYPLRVRRQPHRQRLRRRDLRHKEEGVYDSGRDSVASAWWSLFRQRADSSLGMQNQNPSRACHDGLLRRFRNSLMACSAARRWRVSAEPEGREHRNPRA